MSRNEPDSLDKLESLGRRLDQLKQRDREVATKRQTSRDRADGLSVGLRIGVELVAALAVGTALGYGLDRLAGTLPVGLIVGFFLGSAAGMFNVVRTARELDRRAAARRADQDRK